jgi:1-acyl-sn-glycerol-3-phosphate acyltransferase
VANHLSYLDVVVLGSLVEATFVAKADVAGWPGLGRLAARVGTIFLDRTRKRDLLRVIPLVEARLRANETVVFFPEGTSSGGGEVLRFRSSLFEAPRRAGRATAGAALSYSTRDGDPDPAEAVCWWGDMEFLPHLFGLMKLSGVRATVEWLPETYRASDRKRLAARIHAAIERTRGKAMASGTDGLGAANAALLERSAALVRRLDDAAFCAPEIRPGGAGVGPQLRHCADYARTLLDGLDSGRIDYDARKRDPLFEVNRASAVRELEALAERLRALDREAIDRALLVRTEAAMLPAGADPWTHSSLRRELLMLISHTVHHHALVRERLLGRGCDPGREFGLAPSTREHEARACAR